MRISKDVFVAAAIYIYPRNSPMYPQKKPMFPQIKPCISTNESYVWESVKTTSLWQPVSKKELCISAKELYIPAKELCISAKEPCNEDVLMAAALNPENILNQIPPKSSAFSPKSSAFSDSTKELCIFAKELCISAKEPCYVRQRAVHTTQASLRRGGWKGGRGEVVGTEAGLSLSLTLSLFPYTYSGIHTYTSPYVFANEPYVSAKETNTYAKVVYMTHINIGHRYGSPTYPYKSHVSAKESRKSAKEPYTSAKEPYKWLT